MLQKYIRYCTKKVLDASNIGTSNIGSEMLAEKQEIGFKAGPGVISHDEAKDLVLSEVKKYFKSEIIKHKDFDERLTHKAVGGTRCRVTDKFNPPQTRSCLFHQYVS
ncbi:MAG: hypothetical protein D8M57_18640 [Candidatus Scalindua sp. AMX11]|nr:MAG: hypothetical protein DWQ00_17510 [Candidatus Scalindua sp.]NOG83255.1 hypothetical protein [Planctomycetota bacterium]RZV71983.1 MAG: hypothetical protein EX341_14745 [Candidatus Scalindua sp. SCAELEC01]TDE63377.1 MAG: hypothetical protein D8M57_18640 [Candidatus Scalindua sp. AMX11]GJQ57578.1 MAG: hypothetical protein SCALA701_03790 [Candidatus Scalindua sp.]